MDSVMSLISWIDLVCRYGAVVRGTGAYVPPGARKGPLSPPLPGAPKADIPKVAVNAPDGATVPEKEGSPAPANKVGFHYNVYSSRY